MRFIIFLALTLISQGACTPKFDWRVVNLSSHDNHYTLIFPGKPVSAKKTVQLAGKQYLLTLTGVKIDSTQWVLGHIPANNSQQSQAIARTLAQSFADNLQTTTNHTSAVIVPHSIGAWDVEYATLNSEYYAKARFIWTSTAAYELLSVGKTQELTSDLADTFIQSLQFK